MRGMGPFVFSAGLSILATVVCMILDDAGSHHHSKKVAIVTSLILTIVMLQQMGITIREIEYVFKLL